MRHFRTAFVLLFAAGLSSCASVPVEKPATAGESPTPAPARETPTFSASDPEELVPASPSTTESPTPTRRIPDKALLEISKMMLQ